MISDDLKAAFDAGKREGFKEGREEGKRIEFERITVQYLNTLIQTLHLTPEAAMRLLQIPKDKRKSLAKIFEVRIRQKPEKFLR